MSEIDDLLALLPNFETVTPYELPAQPGATTGAVIAMARMKRILELLNQGGGTNGYLLVNVEPNTDVTDALLDGKAEALDRGMPGITVPRLEYGDVYYLDGPVKMDGVALGAHGFGYPRPGDTGGTVFRCTDASAGIYLAFDPDDPSSVGFRTAAPSFGWKVDGDDIALLPLVLGHLVNSLVYNVHSIGAPLDDGVACLTHGMQNSLVMNSWWHGGAYTHQADGAAANNTFLKCEISGAGVESLRIANDYDKPPTQLDTFYNVWDNCIFEYITETCQRLVHAAGGFNNELRSCKFAVTPGPGGTAPTGMVDAVVADSTSAGALGPGSLRVVKPDFLGYDNLSGAAFHGVAGQGVISVDGGWIGQVPVGLKGVVLIESPPIFSPSCPLPVDHTPTSPSQRPRRVEHEVETHSVFANDALVIEANYVAGESQPRFYRNTQGGLRWRPSGGGAGVNLDPFYGGAWPVLYLANGASLRVQGTYQYPLIMGSAYLWVDGTGDLRIKIGVPSSDTDGSVVGAQS